MSVIVQYLLLLYCKTKYRWMGTDSSDTWLQSHKLGRM